jgi:hypothetical protein
MRNFFRNERFCCERMTRPDEVESASESERERSCGYLLNAGDGLLGADPPWPIAVTTA